MKHLPLLCTYSAFQSLLPLGSSGLAERRKLGESVQNSRREGVEEADTTAGSQLGLLGELMLAQQRRELGGLHLLSLDPGWAGGCFS